MFKSLVLACCVTSIALAGCASHSARTASADPIYTGPAVTLRHAPGSGAVPSFVVAKVANVKNVTSVTPTALDYVNARRAEVGLPPIAHDHGVAAAAADHARYLSLNRTGTHDETIGLPGFTGTDVMSRVRLHTSVAGASEVLAVFAGTRAPNAPIEDIFASPYHRGAIFFDWARAGEASLDGHGSITVMDFADIAPSLAETELVAWPYDGQRDAPTAWVNNELPDPLGADGRYRGQTVGYPITLSGGPNAHIELQQLELRDARGARIACRIAPLTAADAARNTAICTPLQPLRAGATYSVHASGRLTQRASVAPFDLTWRFATRDGMNDGTAVAQTDAGSAQTHPVQ